MADELTPYDRQILDGPVGAFGRYLMERSYEEGMRSAEGTLEGRSRAAHRLRLTRRLEALDPKQRDAVLLLVQQALVDALHGLLHGLSNDPDSIRLQFDGHDVAEESDGLHGDLFLFLRLLTEYSYEPPAVSDLRPESGTE